MSLDNSRNVGRWLQRMTVLQKTYGNFATGVATTCTVFSSLSERI